MNKIDLQCLQKKYTGSEWPEFLAFTLDDDHCQMMLKISRDIRWFEGHFPGQPVLAGVVQTHWVGLLISDIFAVDKAFSRIDNLKFQTVILPDVTVTLDMRYYPEKNAVNFVYSSESERYSEGKFIFSQGE